jgi:uncharacterized membrane protein
MNFNRVAAGNGIQWLSGAINLVMQNLGVFIVMALITAVILIIPILGGLTMLILGPALYGGYIYAAHKQATGGRAEIGDLFAAFNQPGKIGPMIMLCLPGIAAGVLMLLLVVLGAGGAILSGVFSSGGSAAAGIGSSIFLVALLGLAVGLGMFALMFYAIPRVMLDGVEPIQAMKDSFAAALGNIGAMILFALVFCVAYFILVLIPILGWLVLLLVGLPISVISMYFAYRDVFGPSNHAAVSPSAPPPPPVVQ